MRRIATTAFAAMVMMTGGTPVQADPVTELKRLQKCHGLLVRQRIPTDDPLWKAVAAGTKSGTAACMEIFDSARFDSNNRVAPSAGQSLPNERGIRVLATFLEFHRSQMTIPDYGAVINGNNNPTLDVIDANSPAYHFLYSLFKPGETFDGIVKRDIRLMGQRVTSRGSAGRTRSIANILSPLNLRQGDNNTRNSATSDPDDLLPSTLIPWNPPGLAQTGILVGVSPTTLQNKPSVLPNTFKALNGQLDVTEHFGAGLIGEQAYLIGNNDKAGPVDGAGNSYRIWAKNVMSDLLCRDLPALRSSDVIQAKLVVPNSSISYRQGLSCMACHGTMDPMAGVLRNLRRIHTANVFGDGMSSVTFFMHTAPTLGPSPYPTMTGDANFSKRDPNGTLFYRDYNGDLVSYNTTSLQDLGNKLALTRDLYVCAASRYYRFLTGLTANLTDLADPVNSTKLTPAQMRIRENVIELGLKLRNHQSLRTLIQNIISSPEFVDSDHGV